MSASSKIKLWQLEEVQASRVRGDTYPSADVRVLAMFLDDVRMDRLEDDALLFYLVCLTEDDTEYLQPSLDALDRLVKRDPRALAKMQARPCLRRLLVKLEVCNPEASMYNVMKHLGSKLRLHLPIEGEEPRLTELLTRLE